MIKLDFSKLWFHLIVLHLKGWVLLDATCFGDWTRLGLDYTLLHCTLTGLYIVDSTGIYCQQFCDGPLACNVSTSKLIEPSHNCPKTIHWAYTGIFCPSWHSYISGRKKKNSRHSGFWVFFFCQIWLKSKSNITHYTSILEFFRKYKCDSIKIETQCSWPHSFCCPLEKNIHLRRALNPACKLGIPRFCPKSGMV